MFKSVKTNIKLRNPSFTRVIECNLYDPNAEWNLKSFVARQYNQQGKIFFKFTLNYQHNKVFKDLESLTTLITDIASMGDIKHQFNLSGFFDNQSNESIRSFCDNMSKDIPDIKASLGSLSSIVQSCVTDTGELRDSAFASFRNLMGLSDNSFLNTSFLSMSTTIFLLSSTTHLILGFERSKVKLLVLAVVLYVTVHKEDFKQLLTFCWDSIADSFTPVAQAGSLDFDLIKSFATSAICKISGITDKFSIRDYVNLTCNFDKLKTGVVGIFKWFSELLFGFLQWTGITKFVPVKYRYMFENNEDVITLAKEAQSIHQECIDGNFAFSRDNQEKLVALINKMKDLRTRLGTGRSGALSSLSFEINYLTKLSDKIAATGVDVHGTRPEPAVLMIGGKPGQLKSQYLDFFITKAAMNTLSREELDKFKSNKTDFVYNARPETKYWDGYTTAHKFCIFDDFGQTVDAAGLPDNEYMKFIAAVGERPYMLHMANLESKGNLFFNSSYIFATTNLTNFKPASIISPEALIRRFHVCVWAEIKDEYALHYVDENGIKKKKIDPNKFDKDEDGNTKLNVNMVDFKEWFPNRPPALQFGRTLTFDEICDKLITVYKDHQNYFSTKMDVINGMIYPKDSALGSDISDSFSDDDSDDEDIPDLHLDSMAQLEDDEERYYDAPTDIEIEPKYKQYYQVYLETKAKYSANFERHMKKLKEYCMSSADMVLCEASVFVVLLKRFGKKFINCFGLPNLSNRYSQLFQNYLESLYHTDYPAFFARNLTRFKDFSMNKISILSEVLGSWVQHLYDYKLVYSSIIGLSTLYYLLTRDSAEVDEPMYFPCDIPGCSGVLNNDCIGDNQIIVGKFTFDSHNECNYSETQLLFEENYSLDSWKERLSVNELDLSQYLSPVAQVGGYEMKNRVSKPRIYAQAGYDSNGEQQLNSLISNNCYKMSWLSETQSEFDKNDYSLELNDLGMITFLRDTICIMPCHFLKVLKSLIDSDKYPCTYNSTVLLSKYTREGMKIVRRFNFSDMLKKEQIFSCPDMDNKDLVLFKFSKNQANSHRDIIQLFPPQTILQSTKLFTGVLRGMPGSTVSEHTVTAQLTGNQNITVSKSDESIYELHTPYVYAAHTRSGDCGSVLFRFDPKSKSKIFGFHVAGIDQFNYGYSSSISRETLEFVIDSINKETPIIKDSTIEFQTCIPDLDLHPDFQQLFDHELCMNYPNKTSIIPSRLCHKWPMLDVGPSVLSREAYRLAVAKYIRPPIYIDNDVIVKLAKATFVSIVNRSVLYDSSKRVLSYDEAVFGIDDEPDFGPIDRTTSPGFPFVFDKDGLQGKGSWFGLGEDFEIKPKGQKLIEHCLLLEDAMARGERQLFIYTDNLKDEKRLMEKVKLSKTRLFSGCPLDYLLLVRRYFGAFTLWLIKNRIDNGITVGINPYKEWHRLAMNLLKFGSKEDKNFLAGDFSGFDCSGKQNIYWCILDEINNWYDDGPRNALIRRLLWLELVQSRHIHQNHVYEWHSSLPSGHPMTVLVNSIYNLLAFRYCWLRVHHMDFSSLLEFDDHVYLATFGDDVNGSVSHAKKDCFNEKIVQDYMKDLDLVYTSDKKKDFVDNLRTIQDITFLKRSFIFCPVTGVYVGALDKDVIKTTPGWTKTHSSDSICIDNIHFALREFSLWGESDFKCFVELIRPHVKFVYPGFVFDYDYFSNVAKVMSMEYYY
jgi:hypothetical protein